MTNEQILMRTRDLLRDCVAKLVASRGGNDAAVASLLKIPAFAKVCECLMRIEDYQKAAQSALDAMRQLEQMIASGTASIYEEQAEANHGK